MDDRQITAGAGEGIRLIAWVLLAGVLPTWLLVSALVAELAMPPVDIGHAGMFLPEPAVRYVASLGVTGAWMLLIGLVALPVVLILRARRSAPEPPSLGDDVVVTGPVRVRVLRDGDA